MSITRPVYLDYHATTPVDPRVLAGDAAVLHRACSATPSSRQHRFGWQARGSRRAARASRWRRSIGARAKEIVFTSGATEANNLAIRGAVAARRARGNHVVTVATEHTRCSTPASALEREGCRVTVLPVERDGLVDPESLRRGAHRPRRCWRRVMAANNEIGVLQPLRAAVAGVPGARRVAPHRRRAGGGQGAVRRRVERASTSPRSRRTRCTGRRASARSTCGARRSVELDAALHRRRPGARDCGPGTLNVPGIVGFGAAAELCRAGTGRRRPRVSRRCAIACWPALQAGLDGRHGQRLDARRGCRTTCT